MKQREREEAQPPPIPCAPCGLCGQKDSSAVKHEQGAISSRAVLSSRPQNRIQEVRDRTSLDDPFSADHAQHEEQERTEQQKVDEPGGNRHQREADDPENE